MKRTIYFLMISMLTLGCVSNVFAETKSEMANFIVYTAKNFYDQGRYDEAIQEFSKALMIQSENEEAKEYLAKMGLREGIYSHHQSPYQQLGELSGHVAVYRGQMDELQRDKQNLSTKVKLLEADRNHLASGQLSTENEVAMLKRKLDKADADYEHLNDLLQKQAMQKKNIQVSNKSESRMSMIGEKVTEPKVRTVTVVAKADDQLKNVIATLEDKLRSNEDEIVNKEIALARERYDLISHIDDDLKTHDQILKEVVSIKSTSSTKDLDAKIVDLQNYSTRQSKIINDQYKDISAIEKDLQEANDQSERLIQFKENVMKKK